MSYSKTEQKVENYVLVLYFLSAYPTVHLEQKQKNEGCLEGLVLYCITSNLALILGHDLNK